jgi:hypothetical protein
MLAPTARPSRPPKLVVPTTVAPPSCDQPGRRSRGGPAAAVMAKCERSVSCSAVSGACVSLGRALRITAPASSRAGLYLVGPKRSSARPHHRPADASKPQGR